MHRPPDCAGAARSVNAEELLAVAAIDAAHIKAAVTALLAER